MSGLELVEFELNLDEVNTDLEENSITPDNEGHIETSTESVSRFGILKQLIFVKASRRMFYNNRLDTCLCRDFPLIL